MYRHCGRVLYFTAQGKTLDHFSSRDALWMSVGQQGSAGFVPYCYFLARSVPLAQPPLALFFIARTHHNLCFQLRAAFPSLGLKRSCTSPLRHLLRGFPTRPPAHVSRRARAVVWDRRARSAHPRPHSIGQNTVPIMEDAEVLCSVLH